MHKEELKGLRAEGRKYQISEIRFIDFFTRFFHDLIELNKSRKYFLDVFFQ